MKKVPMEGFTAGQWSGYNFKCYKTLDKKMKILDICGHNMN